MLGLVHNVNFDNVIAQMIKVAAHATQILPILHSSELPVNFDCRPTNIVELNLYKVSNVLNVLA